MLVYWQNTVRLICYEASGTGWVDDGAGRSSGFGYGGEGFSNNMAAGSSSEKQRKLPIDHDFKFHKVIMESYALKYGLQRHRRRDRGKGALNGQPQHHPLLLYSSGDDE